ncbi:MAG: IS5 family transposase [Chloroflexi bacterium]|nr:IS5 family transposase [Chloroflexota bacterium]
MQALEPRVVAAVWAAVEPLLPVRPADRHPLGCHRPRIADRACFAGILLRLVTGCSWRTAGRLERVGATTLRGRRTEWCAADVFERLVAEALAAYDRIIGLDLSEVALDGSLHKAPAGGEGTGPNPTDRAKRGWKWSLATDWHGIPIGWATDGANRHDAKLLGPTLEAVGARGLLADIETLHLDRGYDSAVSRATCAGYGLSDVVCARRRPRGTARGTRNRAPLGLRWPVERTNAWLANFGQLRRNTDRRIAHRLAALALAIVLIITVKLIAWADRWNR